MAQAKCRSSRSHRHRSSRRACGFLLIWLSCLPITLSAGEVVFIDTGFCPKLLKKLYPQHSYLPQSFSGHTIDCQKFASNHMARHGQRVVERALKNIKTPLRIHLWTVFNEKGQQSLRVWQKALKHLDQLKKAVVFSAVGLPVSSLKKTGIPSSATLYLAAGNQGRGITQKTLLFPTHLPVKNIVRIGALIWNPDNKSYEKDPFTIRPSKVSRWVKANPIAGLTGSSLALALFANRLLERHLEEMPTK